MLFGLLKEGFCRGHKFALHDCALKSFFIFERTNAQSKLVSRMLCSLCILIRH